jgi:tetratricopeptide (TPR) repeat protein
MRDEALKALLEERWQAALAEYGKRLLKDPGDEVARTNRAIALYEAGRWSEAAKAFAELLRREGPGSEVAPPALFSLGYCRLRLGDARGSLEATALFLELGNDRHPFYRDGVENVACALERLGEADLAARVRGARSLGWSREGILRAAFRVLGWRRKPLPPSKLRWRKALRSGQRRATSASRPKRRGRARGGGDPPAPPER